MDFETRGAVNSCGSSLPVAAGHVSGSLWGGGSVPVRAHVEVHEAYFFESLVEIRVSAVFVVCATLKRTF